MPDATTHSMSERLPGDVVSLLAEGERVLFAVRPGFLSVLVCSWRSLVLLTVIGIVFVLPWVSWRWGPLLCALAGIARLAWEAAVWWTTHAVLTDRRSLVGMGVFRRWVGSVEHDRVEHVRMTKLLAERLLGLGTVKIASAGTGAPEVVWPMLGAPHAVMDALVGTVGTDRAEGAR